MVIWVVVKFTVNLERLREDIKMAEEKKRKKKDNDPFMKTVIRRRNVLKPESESDYSSVLRDALHNENTSLGRFVNNIFKLFSDAEIRKEIEKAEKLSKPKKASGGKVYGSTTRKASYKGG